MAFRPEGKIRKITLHHLRWYHLQCLVFSFGGTSVCLTLSSFIKSILGILRSASFQL